MVDRTVPPRTRVCIIGAGSSGLVALKTLRARGHQAHAFELGTQVGGLWVFGNDNGRSAAYRSLRINTSRKRTEYSDFPLPNDRGDYLHHSELAEYFASYAAHFELYQHITFGAEVLRVKTTESACFVTIEDRKTRHRVEERYDAVVVASGHHHEPSVPSWNKDFAGTSFHSHAYIDPNTPEPLAGKRVCIVGMGNSAMDIAAEACLAGAQVTLAARSPVWVIPKYLRGRPIDDVSILPRFLPGRLRRRIATWGFRHWVGSMSEFGLPEPDHLLLEAHPTLSDQIPQLVQSGRVAVRGTLLGFQGALARFATKSGEEHAPFDVVIYATGYKFNFPFLDDTRLQGEKNELPLYRRVYVPENRRLFFVGLAQTLGAIMPIAELQADWLAAHLSGIYNLPDMTEMLRDQSAERTAIRKRYGNSPRHTMQVDPDEYRAFVRGERVRGERRARRARGLPFPGPSA